MGERQHHTGLTPEALDGVSGMVTCGAPGRVRSFLASTTPVSQIPDEYMAERALAWGTYEDGQLKGAITSGMGPSSIDIVLEELLACRPDQLSFVRAGTAGTVQPYIKTGDIVIATAALRAEGVTDKLGFGPEYLPQCSPEVVAALEYASEQAPADKEWSGNVYVGPKLTKDCLAWETGKVLSDNFLRQLGQQPMHAREKAARALRFQEEGGILASSMELAVVLARMHAYNHDEFGGDGVRNVWAGGIYAIVNSPEDAALGEAFSDDNHLRKVTEHRILEISRLALAALDLHREDGFLADRVKRIHVEQERQAQGLIKVQQRIRGTY